MDVVRNQLFAGAGGSRDEHVRIALGALRDLSAQVIHAAGTYAEASFPGQDVSMLCANFFVDMRAARFSSSRFWYALKMLRMKSVGW